MKIILKYIWNSIKERKLRTAIMLLSVTLSTTLLFVSLSIGASYEEAQRKMSIGYAGNAQVSISHLNDSWISKDTVPDTEGVASVAGVLQKQGLYAEDGYFENFDLIAGELEDINQLNEPQIKSGTLENFSGYKIAVPDRFASKYDTLVGDTIQLSLDGTEYEFEVAAICLYDTIFLRSTRGFNALIPFDTLSTIMDSEGAYSELLLIPEEGVQSSDLLEATTQALNTWQYNITPVYSEAAVAADAQQKSMPFYLISFFTLTISAFIIYSSYKIITSERMPVLGTFRSIGATEKTIKKILVAESLVYGVSGSLLGLPVGYLTLQLLLGSMGNTSSSYGIEIPAVVPLYGIIVSCGIAIIVSILGAYIPISKASKLPVKDVVLGTVEEKNVPNGKILLMGAILFGVSILLPRITSGSLLTIAGGISLLTLILSAILVIPLVLNIFSRILERVYGVLFGNTGRLAARNLMDNKNTSQNVTLLFISISAIIVISVVGSFVHDYIGDVFRDATLSGFSSAQTDQGFIDEVKEIDTVTEVLPLHVLDGEVQINDADMRVEATDNISLFREMLAVNFNDGDVAEVDSIFDTGRYAILNSDAMAITGVSVGDAITISDSEASYEYTVLGSFKSRADDVNVVLPTSAALQDYGSDDYGFFAYKAEDPEAVMKQIRAMYGEQAHWSRTVEEYTNDALETIDTFLAPMNKLTYFILLLAVVGVINNLLINYIQKRRSIAMYKSVGLSNVQNVKMTIIESFSMGLIGSILSIFVSYLEIKAVFIVAGPKIAMEPNLEASTFLFAALMGIGITLVGSVVPILKGQKMKIVEEIKSE